MDDTQIRDHIAGLVSEEHRLLEHGETGKLSEDDRARLDDLEVQLDRFWDLLRQRRARRDAGQDPATAHLRTERVVDLYEQ